MLTLSSQLLSILSSVYITHLKKLENSFPLKDKLEVRQLKVRNILKLYYSATGKRKAREKILN